MQEKSRFEVKKGVRYHALMPYTEVCVHMRVAGKRMGFELVGDRYPMAQLYKPDTDEEFSMSITTGEAGIFHDAKAGYYAYAE